ncbi:MAG: hypothetical protein KGI35_10290, partial [Burkholderiales bacterium]|nr:hypothetical protein [Burkholderiales bacterium]
MGARRPLVSPSGVLAGFEFHTGGPPASRLRRASDAAVARAYTVNVLGAMRLCANQNMTAFARLPAAWLVGLEDDSQFAPGMSIDLLIDPQARPIAGLGQLVERLRRLKVTVGWQPPEAPGAGAPP